MAKRQKSVRRVGLGSKGRAIVLESLESRQLLTVALDPISNVSLPATKTIFVPVHGTDSAGNPINYTVTSSNSAVTATVRSDHPYLKISVANYGDMVFQLFDDLAPNTVSEITNLVNQKFYDGLTFHRVISNFVIQGGDPKGDGTGGPGFTFPDEFNANAIFDGSGQLAMANSGPNTNGSQFFVTVGAQRFLDFNYNLFGQIVSGQSVLQAIDSVATDSSDKPLTPITITSASIIQDTSDTVLMIQAPAGTGSSSITVTGTDSVDHTTQSQMFQANFQADTTNDPPFLTPVANQTTAVGTPITFTLSSTDLENDPVTYTASEPDGLNNATVQVNGNQVTVTPKAGFTGNLNIQVAVQQTGATSRGSTSDPRDIRTLTVAVVNPALTPQSTTITGVAGATAAYTFAHFTATPVGAAANFSASIDFGDGKTGAGTIVANAQGGYDVVATHDYATTGTFSPKVTITGPNSTTASTTSTATIATSSTNPLVMNVIPSATVVKVGTEVSYAIQITNTGSTLVKGVVLTDLLSSGVSFVSSTNTPSSSSGSTIVIPVGDIPAGAVATIIIKENPSALGTFTSQFSATATTGESASLTETARGSKTAPVGFGGGRFDSTLDYVHAPAGVSQNAINLTSHTFTQIISGSHDGWDGLYTIMARFADTKNVTRLDADLARLSHHIPYGAKNLLPTWQQTVDATDLTSPTRDTIRTLAKQLQHDLISYLAENEGTLFNILKSHGGNTYDSLLTFNGSVS